MSDEFKSLDRSLRSVVLDETSLRTPAAIERFGHYGVIGRLGSGGMAELSLAVHEGEGVSGFSKVVALKRVLPALATNHTYVQMFLDEARLAAALDHANIVRIYDVGQCEGSYYLSMEYLPGEDLNTAMLRIESMGELCHIDIAAAIISAAAEGLHFAHEMTDANGVPLGLVHRDISPSNVIVTYYGQVKLVDFGIAKARNNNYRTQEGMMKGKPAYFAPEQVVRGPVDRRTDVYCLGIVLWELLSGSRMFMMDTISATLAAAAAGQSVELATVRPDIEPALEEIVQKALARDRNQRYQTAAELHEALEGYLRGRVRPSAKEIASWLQGAFGEGRANLKKSIARGINLQMGFEQLVVLNEDLAKALSTASSSVGTHRTPLTRGGGRHPRPLWQVLLFAAVAASVVALGVLLSPGPAQGIVELPQRSGTLTVRSEPPGALIFLAGEPTGKKTPSTLEGLPADKQVEVEVQLPGRGKASTTVTLKAGEPMVRSLRINSGGQ